MNVDLPLEHIYVAPDDDPDDAPTLVLLHGRGAHEEDLLPIARQLPQSFHVLSLRAPEPLGPGYTWYALDLSAGGLHASQPDMADFDRSLDLLESSIDAAVDAYGLAADRIGLLGFSQGAILALSAMIEHARRYAWIVALHGYLPERYDREAIAEAGDTPVFLGAGTHDEVIPVSRAETAARRLAEAGIDVTLRTYPIGHGTSTAEISDVESWLADRLD